MYTNEYLNFLCTLQMDFFFLMKNFFPIHSINSIKTHDGSAVVASHSIKFVFEVIWNGGR